MCPFPGTCQGLWAFAQSALTHEVSAQAHKDGRHIILVQAPAVLLTRAMLVDGGRTAAPCLSQAARTAVLLLWTEGSPEALVQCQSDLLPGQVLDKAPAHTSMAPCTVTPCPFCTAYLLPEIPLFCSRSTLSTFAFVMESMYIQEALIGLLSGFNNQAEMLSGPLLIKAAVGTPSMLRMTMSPSFRQLSCRAAAALVDGCPVPGSRRKQYNHAGLSACPVAGARCSEISCRPATQRPFCSLSLPAQ